MATTIKDFGRESVRFGEIPFYYGFPFRFYFGQHQISPEDVETWCQENCVGYYKTVSYTHKDSKRVKGKPSLFEDKIVFIDKIYLAEEADAIRIKLSYDVREVVVKRPRLAARRKKRARTS